MARTRIIISGSYRDEIYYLVGNSRNWRWDRDIQLATLVSENDAEKIKKFVINKIQTSLAGSAEIDFMNSLKLTPQ